ncbi:MAG: tetratricopeptide repeat protein [Bacteroidetes bacterium]|nr:MAG: tetratricopeptide repeat protein [Bacteroidota bacterium]
MNTTRIIFPVAASALILLSIGFFFPSSLNWGFHFTGFLEPYVFIMLILFAGMSLVIVWQGRAERFLDVISTLMTKRPALFLLIVCALFILAALLLRVKIPLLGDSFLLLNNFIYTFSGDHPLYLHRSPLSFGYFYAIASALNTTTYPDLLNAFLVGEIILGIIFILSLFFLVKEIFEQPRERTLAFTYLLTIPYMQLFFGYVELYAVVLTTLTLFTLVAILHLKKKAPFYLVPPAYLLLYAANYLNIILLPALLLGIYIEFTRGKKWSIIIGLLISALLIVGIFAAMDFNIERFFQAAEHGHWLSLTENPGDQFQAYSLLSPYHFLDLFNLLLLLGTGTICFFAFSLINIKKFFTIDIVNACFIASLALFLGFIAVVKFDLGFPKDWDIPASYFFLVNLLAIRIFFQSNISSSTRIALTVIILTLLASVPWFLINASTEPALKRAETLIDKRITSPSGMYQSMFHISMFYHHTQQYERQSDVWKRYTDAYPNDWRGLQNLAKSYYESGERNDSLTHRAFEQWIRVDSFHERGKVEYANFLSERALMNYRRRMFTEAEEQFRNAIVLNPHLPATYNNLASLYLDIKMPDSAIVFSRQAIAIHPAYTLAYQNLANAFAQKAELDTAIAYYEKAINIDPASISAYENMSRAYYQKGEKEKAVDLLRQAARMGSRTAQSLLTMSGERW